MRAWPELPAELIGEDEALRREIDAEIGRASRAAHGWLACRIGCTACCVGPFDITALDAGRLRTGLARLAAEDGVRARAIVARSRRQWEEMTGSFPGSASGVLDGDGEERQAFFSRFAAFPCPALDGRGACELYEHRPLSCRSYGLPVRLGAEVLPACELNLVGAPRRVVDAATLAFDPRDGEGRLLERLGWSETIVAAVLAAAFCDGASG